MIAGRARSVAAVARGRAGAVAGTKYVRVLQPPPRTRCIIVDCGSRCANFPMSTQRSFFSSDAQSSASACDLVVEMRSRIAQDEDVIRARVMTSGTNKLATRYMYQETAPQRPLKDIASDFCQSYLSSDHISLVLTDADADADADADNKNSREAVILHLAKECGLDYFAIDKATNMYQSTKNTSDDRRMIVDAAKIRQAYTPRYIPLFNEILSSAQRELGLSLLIQLRHDVRMYVCRMERETSLHQEDDLLQGQLKQMDNDLKTLLTTLFLQPILELRRITYENTSAAIIEKIAMKEAVHPLRSLEDLRNRLGPDRRCFAFFHPSLPTEPLVFVHVALLSEAVPETMEDIGMYASTNPRVATFYSITSTQPGLTGVDLGQFLIKRVVAELQGQFPAINTFCTLSPIPRLRKWIESKLHVCQDGKQIDSALLNNDDMQALADIFGCSIASAPSSLVEFLKDALWYEQRNKAKALEPILMKLAAHYLTKEKHRGKPIDGVAKFHIRNGAQMYRLNFLADKSRKGLHNSAGIMINYRYEIGSIEQNNVAYESNGIIPVKEGVSKWLGA